MDLKCLLFAALKFLLLILCLAEANDRSCLTGFLWNNAKQACVTCLELCQKPRAAACLNQCVVTSKLIQAVSAKRRRRDVNKPCGVKCSVGTYCDINVGDCTSCGIICDFSEIQGTTDECNSLCPGYSSTTLNHETTTPSPDLDPSGYWTGPEVQTLLYITLGVGGLIILGVSGLICCRYRGTICQKFRSCSEERKAPIPCSQESEEGFVDSKTPLNGTSGPVVQEQNWPQVDSQPHGDLGAEMGFPEIECPYTELDGPATLSTNPKQLMTADV